MILNRQTSKRLYECRTSSEGDISENFTYFHRPSDLLSLVKTVIDNELTDKERTSILKHYYENKSITVTAKEMDVCPSTVSRTLCRAEKKIRRYLKYAFYVVYGRFPSENLSDIIKKEM